MFFVFESGYTTQVTCYRTANAVLKLINFLTAEYCLHILKQQKPYSPANVMTSHINVSQPASMQIQLLLRESDQLRVDHIKIPQKSLHISDTTSSSYSQVVKIYILFMIVPFATRAKVKVSFQDYLREQFFEMKNLVPFPSAYVRLYGPSHT